MKHPTHRIRSAKLAATGTMMLLLSACAVRSLPPYNPPPLPDPNAQQTRPTAPSSPAVSAPVPTPSAPTDERNLVALAADLSGGEVVPAADTSGRGEFAAVYDRSTRLLRWKSSVSGLRGEITGVSFNGPADLDQNAPAVIGPVLPPRGAAGSVGEAGSGGRGRDSAGHRGQERHGARRCGRGARPGLRSLSPDLLVPAVT